MSVAAYRTLLKAQRALFSGDHATRAAALIQTKEAFMSNADAPPAAVPEKVQEALDAADFLRENVAQTVSNDRGNFEMRPTEHHLHTGTEPPPLPCDSDLNK